ncbi:PREDICTED: uncharacterized protein LOC106806055 [Priapulus caudatus]|uniref:Uncharacterized protein LOC106806055 n=1 Tax=Priapulus caudatus TaxID=37621 RepID=A0ABM1DTW2_PRICU|nr:PREDICTED: uncharacterized protein LOC106806055 [Priapulus caudatus]
MQRANLKQFADVLLVCKVCREPFENSSALLDHVDKMHLQLPVQVPGSSPMRVLKTYTRNKKPLEVIESTTSLNMSKSKTETVPPAQLQSTPTGGTSVFKQPLVSLLRIQTPSDQVPTAAAQATGASSSLSQVVPSTDLKCIPTAVPPARNLLFQAEIENKALLNAVDSDDISEEGKTEVNLVEEHDDSNEKQAKLLINRYKVESNGLQQISKGHGYL